MPSAVRESPKKQQLSRSQTLKNLKLGNIIQRSSSAESLRMLEEEKKKNVAAKEKEIRKTGVRLWYYRFQLISGSYMLDTWESSVFNIFVLLSLYICMRHAYKLANDHGYPIGRLIKSQALSMHGLTCQSHLLTRMSTFANAVREIASNHAKYTFPAYLKALTAVNVRKYDISLMPHVAVFESTTGETYKHLNPDYDVSSVSNTWDLVSFKEVLKRVQTGVTGYHTFLLESAASGVDRYTVDFIGKTCTYFSADSSQNLVENIPSAFFE